MRGVGRNERTFAGGKGDGRAVDREIDRAAEDDGLPVRGRLQFDCQGCLKIAIRVISFDRVIGIIGNVERRV